MIKSAFMLTEAMFAINSNEAHSMIIENCLNQLFLAVDQYLFGLNADIMALNNSLEQD